MKSRSHTSGTARCLIQIITVCQVVNLFTEAATNKLVIPSNARCACPDDVLTFTCTVVGPGTTIWSGSAFNCPSTTNEIILRHSQFASPGTSGNCNSGAIKARSIGVQNNNCFSSELNVTASADLNNKTLQCQHNSIASGTILVNETALTVASAYPPPSDVKLADIGQGQITFNWREVAYSCYSFDYVITSDCGACPPTTSTTSATCTGLQLPTEADGVVCSFSVSSRVCGIAGDPSIPVILSVPDTPKVKIAPGYSNYSQQLRRLFITITMNSAAVISSDITKYGIAFSTNSINETSIMPYQLLPCEASVCNYTVDVPSAFCSPSNYIDVNVSANNRIGRGPSSNTTTIGCTNEIVRMSFDLSTSTLFCLFLNGNTDSMKSCSITYWFCNGETTTSRTIQNSSTSGDLNTILVDLAGLEDGTYCYVATTVIGVTTIKVEGNLTKSANAKKNIPTVMLPVAIGISLAIIIIIIIVIVLSLAILLVVLLRKRARRSQYNDATEPMPKKDKFSKVPKGYFKVKQVDSDKISLQALLKSEGHEYYDWNKYSVFLECDSSHSKSKGIRDIHKLLLDKVTKDVYYAGRDGQKTEELSASKRLLSKSIFTVAQSKRDLVLEKGTFVIYENPNNYLKRRFHVLEVGEDKIQLSEFIMSKFGWFDEERAFYQLSEEEKQSLSCCRKMIRVPKTEQLTQPNENGEYFQATIGMFYIALGIPRKPAMVSKSSSDFIHGVSQGSRYLQKGTYVLYELIEQCEVTF